MQLGEVRHGPARPDPLEDVADPQVGRHQQSIPDQFAEPRPGPVGLIGGQQPTADQAGEMHQKFQQTKIQDAQMVQGRRLGQGRQSLQQLEFMATPPGRLDFAQGFQGEFLTLDADVDDLRPLLPEQSQHAVGGPVRFPRRLQNQPHQAGLAGEQIARPVGTTQEPQQGKGVGLVPFFISQHRWHEGGGNPGQPRRRAPFPG